MLIGFDGSRAFAKNKTGTENYSFQLLKHLAKIDSKNHYHVYLRPDNVIAKQEAEGVIPATTGIYYEVRSLLHTNKDGSRIKSGMTGESWPANFTFELIDFPRFWTQVGLAIETFHDKLDVLFTPSHTIPLFRKPGLKTVMTVHDLGAEYLPGMHQLKQKLYLDFITHFQLKSTTKLIAVSKATKDDLVKKVGINPKKISVIYEGVNFSSKLDLKTDQLNSTLKYYEIERDKYFFFLGTIQPRKNLERLVKAYDRLVKETKEIEETKGEKSTLNHFNTLNSLNPPFLVLAGSKGWLSDEIYSLPKKLGIEDKVKFLGRVPDEDLPALYQGALAFVYPSLFEGFGLPILEAMINDTPVLTSNLSSMPEVAGDAAILVDPNNEESIKDGLEKLLDKDLRDKLVEKGRKQVKKFNWEKCARETLEVLERTVKETKGG